MIAMQISKATCVACVCACVCACVRACVCVLKIRSLNKEDLDDSENVL